MANSASHAALPYPIKGARYTIPVPYLDADGDPTDPTTPDTEISKDGGAFADCAEEVSTITGSNGAGYITLSGAELDCSLVVVCAKVASGPKATLLMDKPRVLASISTGTLSAGSAGGGTLGTVLAYDVTGCFIKTTGGTGGGGTGGANNQARKMITYNTSTGAFTVAPNWETTPSTDTTYDVLLPEGVTLGMLKALNPTTAGRTLTIESDGMAHADLKEWLGSAPNALTSGRVEALVGAMANNVMTAAAAAADLTTELQSGLATAAALDAVDNFIDTEVAAILAAVDTEVAAIKAVTDALPDAGALTSLATQASVNTIDDFLDTEIAAIKAKTDNLPASPAASGDSMALTAAAVDAVLDDVVEGSITLRQAVRAFLAALAGKSSGHESGAPRYRDQADSKNRIAATTDANGNRSAVTLDLT